jgi:hypothetical protein
MGIKGYQGVSRVSFASETAQVELKSGRVQAPAHDHTRTCPSSPPVTASAAVSVPAIATQRTGPPPRVDHSHTRPCGTSN